MSESLFPAPIAAGGTAGGGALPLAREVAWDYERDRPVFRRGEPVIVTGLEAVRVWVWNALRTDRFRHEHHTRGYGSEMGRLIGQTFSGDLKRAEAVRYFREALAPNPYITGVENVGVTFAGNTLTVTGTVRTIYGEMEGKASV